MTLNHTTAQTMRLITAYTRTSAGVSAGRSVSASAPRATAITRVSEA